MNKLNPAQIFIKQTFTQQEISVTKSKEISRLFNILDNLSKNDIKIILDYNRFLENFENSEDKILNEEKIYYFKRAPRFEGRREGWVFKTGQHGTGYYLDVNG